MPARIVPSVALAAALTAASLRALAQDAPSAPSAPAAPSQPEILTPGAGRVPVDVRASGAALEVSGLSRVYRLDEATLLARDDGTVATPQWDATASVRGASCRTPCTLYVPPGVFELAARGGGFDAMRFSLTVPPTGSRVLLRTPDGGLNTFGATLLALGGLALAGGVVLVVVSFVGPHGLLVPGLATGGGGAAAMILGGVLLGTTGPALLEARARVAVRPVIAPLAGGGAMIALGGAM